MGQDGITGLPTTPEEVPEDFLQDEHPSHREFDDVPEDQQSLNIADLIGDQDDPQASDGFDDAEFEQEEIGAEELASRVRRLVELRAEKDETDKAAKRAKKAHSEYEQEFYDLLERSPLKGSIKIDLGGEHGVVQIVPRETYYGRVINKDKALEYFNNRALTEEFSEVKIAAGKVNELVRDLVEQGKPLPDGIDYYAKRFFTVSFKD